MFIVIGIDMKKPRDYKKEHKAGGKLAKAKRTSRNRANRIMRKTVGVPKGSEVHHVNGNPLDNRKMNLKVVPKSTNRRNQPKRKNNGRRK